MRTTHESSKTVTDAEFVTEESYTTKQKLVLDFSTSHEAKLVTEKSLSTNKATVLCASRR